MPRKNPISERDRTICRVMFELRQTLNLTRPAFARRVGLTEITLRHRELGAAPWSPAQLLKAEQGLRVYAEAVAGSVQITFDTLPD